MAGTDNIVFNTRERPLSTDWNNVEAMLGRTVLDMLRYGQSLRQLGVPLDSVRNVVLGGLIGSPAGSDVSISPGALLQDSAVLAPVPGALDSTYRVGIQRTALTQVMPAPGADTFYLIEAQMVEVTTVTSSVDILDAGTGVFVPTVSPKQRERRIQLQLLTGGVNAPAPSGGDWIPLCIVRRPSGGGPVLATDIIDVRPLAEWGRERPAVTTVEGGSITTAALAANNVFLQARMDGPTGRRCVERAALATDLTAASILSPATVLAASTWFYLYLAPWSTLRLNPRQVSPAIANEGVLVLSHLASDAFRGGGTISLPAPYGGAGLVASGEAYLVAAIRRNAANTGWDALWSGDLRHFHMADLAIASVLPPVAGANAVAPVAGLIPSVTPRSIDLKINYLGNTASASMTAANIRIITLRQSGGGGIIIFAGTALEAAGGATQVMHPTPFPRSLLTDNFDVFLSAGVNDPASSMLILLSGYEI